MAAVAGTLGLASSKPAKSKDVIGVGKVLAHVRKGVRRAVGKENVRSSRVLLKPELSNREVVGTCHVRVIDTGFPAVQSPFLIFRVETEEVKVRPKDWQEKEIKLSLTSLPSLVDLHVHLFDEMVTFLRPQGRAIIPLGPLIFPSIQDAFRQMVICGSPCEFRSPETRLRLSLMPPSKRSLARSSSAPPGPDELVEKFKPAIRGVPGSGHFGNPADVAGIGTLELAVSIEFFASAPLWQELLRPPWQPSSDGSASKDFLQKDAEDAFKELKPKLLQQGQNRLWKCFRLPALVRLVLESRILTLIAVLLWIYFMLRCPLWPCPLLVWGALVANGLLDRAETRTLWQKGDTLPSDECAYPIWEEQVGKRSVSYGATQIMQIQFVLYEMQVLLNGGASVLEKLHSLSSFVDPALSAVYYLIILVVCSFFTLTLWLDLTRPIAAIFGALALVFGCTFYDEFESVQTTADRITDELRRTKFGLSSQWKKISNYNGDESPRHEEASEESMASTLLASGMHALRYAQSFLSRVPADPELAHRFIASQICSSPLQVKETTRRSIIDTIRSSKRTDSKRSNQEATSPTAESPTNLEASQEECQRPRSPVRTIDDFLGEDLSRPLLGTSSQGSEMDFQHAKSNLHSYL